MRKAGQISGGGGIADLELEFTVDPDFDFTNSPGAGCVPLDGDGLPLGDDQAIHRHINPNTDPCRSGGQLATRNTLWKL